MTKRNPRFVKEPLSKPQKQAANRSLWLFGLFAVLTSGFLALAREVRDKETLSFDVAVLHDIHALGQSAFDLPIIWLTNFGGPIIVPLLTLVFVLLLFRRRNNTAALKVALSVGGAGVINLVLKSIFERTRPELWQRLVNESSFSFPSGHAMVSSALAASLIAITWNTRFQYQVLVVGIVYTGIIGFTRLYLGVHYPTDIIAGWMVSVAWVVLVNWIFTREHKKLS